MTVKLIISTMSKLVYWDGSQAHTIHEGKLEEGTAHYHGITWDLDGIMYVSGKLDFQYILYKFDISTFQEVGILHGDLYETHQIFWYDGKIHVTNTGKNRIDIYQDNSWRSVAWHPSDCDIEHINAIWSDGRNMYVGEHRQKVPGGSVVRICTMDLDLLDTIAIGPNIHNVYREGDCLYNLTSPQDGRPAGIVITDLVSKKQCRVDKPEWGEILLRGLVRVEDGWYVGVSRWETDRSQRHVGDAIIIQMDNDFEDIDRITLSDYGPVGSLRALDVESPSHNGIVISV